VGPSACDVWEIFVRGKVPRRSALLSFVAGKAASGLQGGAATEVQPISIHIALAGVRISNPYNTTTKCYKKQKNEIV
jgi:hypothetical protein